MMGSNGRNFYPSLYGPAPFPRAPNHFNTGSYYGPVYPQQKPLPRLTCQTKKETTVSNTSSFKLFDHESSEQNDILRLIFAYVGVPFRDKRLKEEEWTKIKEQMPFDQLPILRVNDHLKISPLYAIVRYLAEEFRLYGTNKQDHTIIDIVLEVTRQFAETKAPSAKISSQYLKQSEKLYEIFDRKGPFYLGSYVSIADLIVYHTINHLIKNDPTLLENLPRLKEGHRRLEKNPRLLNYINKKTNPKNGHSNDQKPAPPQRHRTISPTPNPTSRQERHRSHDPHKSHHHHYHCCRHRRCHSKEPTPLSQTRQLSINSSNISLKDKERPADNASGQPPPPAPPLPSFITEQKSANLAH